MIDLATLRALYAANAPPEPVPTTVATTTPPPPPPTQPPPTQPPPPEPTEPPTEPTTPPAEETLFDVLVNDGRFTTLVGLLESINYSELDRRGVYTVFAPTDDAFAAAAADIEGISPEALLAYHVAPGIYPASGLFDGLVVETIHGGDGDDHRRRRGLQGQRRVKRSSAKSSPPATA